MRAQVQQRTLLQPPAGRELPAQEGAVEIAGAGAGHLGVPRGGEERPGHRVVPLGQDQLRHHARLRHGVRHAPGRGQVRAERLLQQQRLAAPGGQGRQLGLHGGRHGERHRLAPVEQLLEAARHMGPVRGRRLVRRLGAAGPDGGEPGLGSGREDTGVHGTGPGAGADQADLDGPAGPGGGGEGVTVVLTAARGSRRAGRPHARGVEVLDDRGRGPYEAGVVAETRGHDLEVGRGAGHGPLVEQFAHTGHERHPGQVPGEHQHPGIEQGDDGDEHLAHPAARLPGEPDRVRMPLGEQPPDVGAGRGVAVRPGQLLGQGPPAGHGRQTAVRAAHAQGVGAVVHPDVPDVAGAAVDAPVDVPVDDHARRRCRWRPSPARTRRSPGGWPAARPAPSDWRRCPPGPAPVRPPGSRPRAARTPPGGAHGWGSGPIRA